MLEWSWPNLLDNRRKQDNADYLRAHNEMNNVPLLIAIVLQDPARALAE